jgi:hypothetical protein
MTKTKNSNVHCIHLQFQLAWQWVAEVTVVHLVLVMPDQLID